METRVGKVSSTTATIAITPQEFFINDMLDVIVLNASEMEGPTIGTKLPNAKRAVFIESESALCVSIFCMEKTKENTIIQKPVTVRNVLFINLIIPPISFSPLIAFTSTKQKQAFTIGTVKTIRTFSIRMIKRLNDAFPRAAVDSLPLTSCIAVIKGVKAVITLQISPMYDMDLIHRFPMKLNTARDMHRVEQKPYVSFIAEDSNPSVAVLNIEEIIIAINISDIEFRILGILAKS